MNGRVKKLSCVVVVAASLLGAGACSRPAENDPIRVTGDTSKSNPALPTTTEAPEAEETTTTRYWAPDGPGVVGEQPAASNDDAGNGNGSNSSTTTTTEAD